MGGGGAVTQPLQWFFLHYGRTVDFFAIFFSDSRSGGRGGAVTQPLQRFFFRYGGTVDFFAIFFRFKVGGGPWGGWGGVVTQPLQRFFLRYGRTVDFFSFFYKLIDFKMTILNLFPSSVLKKGSKAPKIGISVICHKIFVYVCKEHFSKLHLAVQACCAG